MTNADPMPRKSIQEAEIDRLLAEEFACDPEFSKRFANACGLQFEALQVQQVEPEPSLGGDGFGDLLVEATVDGQRAAFLIEDKITAGAPPRQAARYSSHAERMRRDGREHVLTVLVAPRAYRGERDRYDATVDLEDVAEMLDSPDPRRRDYRRRIIERALEKKAPAGVRNPDPAMRRLHSDYLEWTKNRRGEEEHPFEFPRLKEAYYDGDSWIDKVHHPDFPGHVWLRHRLWTSQRDATGRVDLIVSPASAEERTRLEAAAPEDGIIESYGSKGQGIRLSLPVPEMRQATGFCEASAAEALMAMHRLTGFLLRVRKG